jgi:hypothetical protein
MIGLLATAGWLDVASGSISMDISSPFFEADAIPGTTTYPFGLPMSASNQARLNFPHLRADQGEVVAPEPVSFYIDGILRWVGALVYLDCEEEQQLYE